MRRSAASNPGPGGDRSIAVDDNGGNAGVIFAGAFGLLLGLALVKFGNPVVLKNYTAPPSDALDWLMSPWQQEVGYWILAPVAILGVFAARWQPSAPRILLALPAAWLVWQVVSGTQSVDNRLSHETLIHFLSCVVCFYLGLFSLSSLKKPWLFWLGLVGGFTVVLALGFEQHFGGLEQTRRYYYLYIHPVHPMPEDFIKRLEGNRVFSTLFYANTLAGVIIMVMPIGLAFIASAKERLTIGARRFLIVVFVLTSLACLYWSGSKGGWLLMLLIGLVAVMLQPLPGRIKMAVIVGALIVGLAGFFAKYAGFFQKGAPSAVARFDYWRGAAHATRERPLLGSGPGTFGVVYAKMYPEAHEKPRMTHNDYLEQASDSGIPGFLFYTGMVAGCLWFAVRGWNTCKDPMEQAVWLGLLGWALHSLLEFGLYIPAVAWPAFALMGWMIGRVAIRSTGQGSGDKVAATV